MLDIQFISAMAKMEKSYAQKYSISFSFSFYFQSADSAGMEKVIAYTNTFNYVNSCAALG